MLLLRKLKTFFTISGRIKWLLFKAVFISAIVRITLYFLPFKIILNWLGNINIESDNSPHSQSLHKRKEIKTAIAVCDKYVFWKTGCYTQAVTCKLLLKQNNLPSTVYIGFYKDEQGKYIGHAWLRSYDTILTGNGEIDRFTVQSFFT